MRAVNFIVTLSLFSVETAGWNRFHGHGGHRFGPQDFGDHHGSHQFDQESAHFEPPYKHPHFRPTHKYPYYDTHHESPDHESPHTPPYSTPRFGYTQRHHGYHFGPPHIRPPWERPNWDIPGSIIKDCDNDTSSSSSSSEDYNDDRAPSWYTQKTPQWTTPTSEQTTTDSTIRSIWNKPSFHRNKYTPTFTTLSIHWGVRTKPSTASTVSTTNSRNVEGCVMSCRKTMTPEYNPVCGTNNLSYQNIGMLLCAKGCGVDVEFKRNYRCPNPIFDDEDTDDTTVSGQGMDTTHVNNSEQTTHTAPPAASGRTMLSLSILNCMQTCPFNGDFSPVCGTNLVTYFNHDRYMCAKKCGVDVELKCRFPCATSNCHIVEATTTKATTTTSSWNVAKTRPPWPSLQHCFSACVVSTEYNPVCGTNNITYSNPSKLQCAQICGVDVREKYQSTCRTNEDDNTTPLTTTTASTTLRPFTTTASTTLRPFTLACIRGCVVTPEHNPVCGTNYVTYTNPGKLECAKMCGVDVEILLNTACEISNPNDFTPITEPPTKGGDVTTQTTSSGLTRLTIDPILLDRIFGTATTTELIPTTEEVFDIDPRFSRL